MTDCIQCNKIVHAVLVCTEGMNVRESVILDVSSCFMQDVRYFFFSTGSDMCLRKIDIKKERLLVILHFIQALTFLALCIQKC